MSQQAQNLDKFTVAQLREILEQKGITYDKSLRKPELIALLTEGKAKKVEVEARPVFHGEY